MTDSENDPQAELAWGLPGATPPPPAGPPPAVPAMYPTSGERYPNAQAEGYYLEPQPVHHRRRRRLFAGIVVLAVTALVATLAVALTGTSHPTGTSGSASAPSDAVLVSAQNSLANKTAHLSLSMTMTLPGGQTATASGSGALDFTDRMGQVSTQYSGLGPLDGTQMNEVFAGDTVYLSLPSIAQVVPGKSWISESVGATGSLAPASSDPTAMLQYLANEGNTVTPIGSSTIAGQPVKGYRVVISPQVLAQGIQRLNLPPAEIQGVQSLFGSAGIHMTVYVDDAANVVRRVDFAMRMTVQGKTLAASVTEDVTNYGAPVSVTPPPPDQVVSLQEFESAVGALATPPSSNT